MQEAGENWRKRAGFHRWRISWKTTSIKAVAGTRCSVHTPACRSVKTSKICRRIATTSRPKTNRSVPNRWIGWNCRRDFSLFIFCFIILFFFQNYLFPFSSHSCSSSLTPHAVIHFQRYKQSCSCSCSWSSSFSTNSPLPLSPTPPSAIPESARYAKGKKKAVCLFLNVMDV